MSAMGDKSEVECKCQIKNGFDKINQSNNDITCFFNVISCMLLKYVAKVTPAVKAFFGFTVSLMCP